ncbi:MAG TPA: O-antigen ligase family protein [Gaiellaceae bacterium]|nr:O-antigen ligase family protein [Gaiellaceae bacterium]
MATTTTAPDLLPGAGLEEGADERTRALLATAGLVLAAVPLTFLSVRQPVAALLLLAGLVTLALCLLRAEAALLVLVASAPLDTAVSLGSDTVTLTKVAGVIAFASLLFHLVAGRRKLYLDTSHAVVAGILAIAMVSMLLARDSGLALETTLRYASFVAVYVMVTQFVGDHGVHRAVAWALSLSAAAAGAVGLARYLSDESAVATLPNTNANDFAFVLATTLPLAFWLLGSRAALRPLVLVVVGLVAAGVLLSFSRGAVVGLAAGLAWELLTRRRRFPALAAGAVVAALAVLVVIRADPARFESGLELKQRVAQYNVESRLDAWRGAAKLVSEHPLLGVGPGNFRVHFYEATGNPPGTHNLTVVHNAYLDIAAELGVLAAALFLLYLAMVFLRSDGAARNGLGTPGLAHAVQTALVIAAVAALFLSEQYFAPFWLLGGLATVVWAGGRVRDAAGA